jgi:PleD family two-component response regulator
MAKRMAELQGGTVELRSQPNHGTLVVVSLPIHTEMAENEHGYTSLLTPEQTGALREIKDAMADKVVLVADRDRSSVELVEYYLEIFNVKPRIVSSVPQMRTILEEEPVALLILDVTLPEMDAPRLLREIRAKDRYASLPIIATSPIQHSIDQTVIRSLKVNDFLIKPFHFSDLGSKIRKYIQ